MERIVIGVCFKREKDWEQDQWSYVFSNFGVEDLWEMGDDSNKDLNIYQPTIKISSAAELPDRPLVVLAPQESKYIVGEESLKDFVHPDDAIYMFGGSHCSMTGVDLGGRVADHYVYIPLVKNECFSHSAAYITLWDRELKDG
jgi:hypothetical protein